MLHFDDDPLACLKRIHSTVRSFLPRSFDTESVSVDILIESASNGVLHPPRDFIRMRCQDKARSAQREKLALERRSHMFRPEPDRSADDPVDMAHRLIGVLSPLERKIVFYRFFLDGGLPLAEIARRLRMDLNVVRETIAQALYKMREEAYE